MNRLVLAALLLVVTLQQSDNNPNYQLSPPLPPTAFVGQYYTCQFRVLGMDFPTFDFRGLPTCFTGSKAGMIEGVPDIIGSFPLTVVYWSGSVKFSRDIVIRIASAMNSLAGTQATTDLSLKLSIISKDTSYMFMAGNLITINLKAIGGAGPYQWSYLRLPEELRGDKNGKIQGTFEQEGYYSFGVTCSDSLGNSTDSFFTLNIQPLTFFSRTSGSTAIANIPNRNQPLQFSPDEVTYLQSSAVKSLFEASKLLTSSKLDLANARLTLATSNSSLSSAQKQLKATEILMNNTLQSRALAVSNLNDADINKTKTKDRNELAKSVYDQATIKFQFAGFNLMAANNSLLAANATMNNSNINFIKAQDASSKAAAQLQRTMLTFTDSQVIVNLTFTGQTLAKQLLQNANNQAQIANSTVSAAVNQRDIAQLANDLAGANLNTANSSSVIVADALRNATKEVERVRVDFDAAKTSLGVAKFNLNQAMNNLYVAQAAKEQADKATNLISSQASSSPINSTTIIFGGCDAQTYPTIFGTSYVTSIDASSLALSSGATILRGPCTKQQSIKAGDLVSFQGYLKSSYVHAVALSIAK